jgi:hypothetical protein
MGSKPTKIMETPCKCAMDGIHAYCGSIPGTTESKSALAALNTYLEGSNCHTMDRFNFENLNDVCTPSIIRSTWMATHEKLYNTTYWPYTQDIKISTCINKFFSDSYINLTKNLSFSLGISLMTILMMIGLTFNN